MTRFAYRLEQAARVREQRIWRQALASSPRPSFSLFGDPHEGFLPLEEAAAAMGMSEAEVVELVERGGLEAHEGNVRPAIVSWLGVA